MLSIEQRITLAVGPLRSAADRSLLQCRSKLHERVSDLVGDSHLPPLLPESEDVLLRNAAVRLARRVHRLAEFEPSKNQTLGSKPGEKKSSTAKTSRRRKR